MSRDKSVHEDVIRELAGPAERTDGDIAWAAANALAWNALVPQGRVSVSVSKGWIVLEGAVDQYFQRRLAEDAVAELAGVVGVTNLIDVRPVIPAQELKKEIENALERSTDVNARRIEVEVEGDCVRLWGCVATLSQREAAERVAWSAPGIRTLSDHLTIESGTEAQV